MRDRLFIKEGLGSALAAILMAALFAAVGTASAFAAETGFKTSYCKQYSGREGGMTACIEKEKKAKISLGSSRVSSRVKSYCEGVMGGEKYSYYLFEKCISDIENPKIEAKPGKKGQVVPFPESRNPKVQESRRKTQEIRKKAQERDEMLKKVFEMRKNIIDKNKKESERKKNR